MAAQCAKCLAERKGFRRELDSWRHKLVHCVGLETILEEIYGPMLLRDLNLCMGCEPKKVDDWSAEASVSHCSFCNLPLDKLSDQVPATVSPLSSPSDYSPCQTSTTSESSQSAHKFLQAVFHKKDVTLDCDPKIPLVAQELMNKIIHQFAEEYASKCLLPTTTNGITRPSSPLSETSDAPLDLTVNRTNCVLDLSNRNSASSAISTSNHSASGRQHKMNEYIERSWELSEGLLSKALKDIRSGRLLEQRAALLYGIPLQTLQQGLENWTDGKLDALHQFKQGERDYMDETTSHGAMSSTLGGEARLVLQKVAAWAERAEIGGGAEENPDSTFPSSTLAFYQPSSDQKAFPQRFLQLRNALLQPTSPSPSLGSPTTLRIPQVRSLSDHNRAVSAETASMADHLRQRTSLTEGTASLSSASPRPLSFFKLRSPLLAQGCSDGASQLPDRLGPRRSSLDETEDGCRDKDKQPRKKRGRYRQYDHELMEEAITMVMAGRMSVSKAQGVYGVPHSTLEYKVKERTGTLKNPPKKKSTTFSSSSNLSASGTMTSSSNSGNLASTADAKGF
ncbi:PREDICTED: ligand-dependent nuclear receptor corepressor-like protein isoform X6 [Cyprinodon variegatus]|uniref:Ligand dependent nuclear receptor corepressor-like n=1 Tax=Cyprinodon variegatus TaxID=28743 RepID=A0A3Q2DMC8_CYPVA|nr:PREDICTED: ligand-dependent nuclear receptor corepressor-like protein isoform X6 [Cyprinodon variegatus]